MANSSVTRAPVGVIGLGLLGTALAERLITGGYHTFVWNRSREKADALIAAGAHWSDNPLVESERTVICLYTTEVVEEVLVQMDAGLRKGQTLIDTTTGDPSQTSALGGKLAARGVQYLEAPIAASSEQTRRGEALAMIAGDEQVFEACREVIECLAPKNFYLGPWGTATKMKLVNNLVLGLNRVALAEGLVFATALGMDPAKSLAVLKEGNAYSVVMDVKGQKMLSGDFTPQGKLTQHLKDVRLILEEAKRAGIELPLSQVHRRLLIAAEEAGFGEQDNSAIIRAIENATG
ncbi:MAG: NAD(P)-dependent oxidoreductase [Bythopirellula sp.]|nr:NAD(P)-dependent oxidoreductase [Bythopirellula sp.]